MVCPLSAGDDYPSRISNTGQWSDIFQGALDGVPIKTIKSHVSTFAITGHRKAPHKCDIQLVSFLSFYNPFQV